MFLLDTSASVSGQHLEQLRNAAAAALELLNQNDRASVISFSDAVRIRSEWTSDRSALGKALDALQSGGTTRLYDAAYAALRSPDALAVRSLILVFTDGSDTASWLSGEAVIAAAHRSDVVVYGIGPPTNSDELGFRFDLHSGTQSGDVTVAPIMLRKAFLPELAAATGGRYIGAARGTRLRDTFRQILTEFRQRYLLTYVPNQVDRAGWHTIDVRLKSRKGAVTARRGYAR
jgi:VWFA-related protein